MKIISKFKDYYDYLKGIYGEDPKLVLDRTEFNKLQYPGNGIDTFYIGDYKIQGYWKDGNIYFGKDVEKFHIEDRGYWWMSDYNKNESYVVEDSYHNTFSCLKYPKKINNSPTYKENCPILKEYRKDEYIKNPILKEYGFQKVFKAEEIWIILSEWLGRVITMNEKPVPIGDDKTRILSHGFDLKTSFRGK